MFILHAIGNILGMALVCGFIGIGIAANHNYSAKTAFFVGIVLGAVLGVIGVATGIAPQ